MKAVTLNKMTAAGDYHIANAAMNEPEETKVKLNKMNKDNEVKPTLQ